jgi:phospho-N-acetylmuramoyl-pentapeptide-transferase
MLYLLSLFSSSWSALNVFRYITFRTGGAVITAFLIVLITGPAFIRWLKSRQGAGQPIRSNGPETHQAKKGTPTMGGLLIVLASLISVLLWGSLTNPYVWITVAVFIGFGLIGFVDDYLKLTKRNTAGISGRKRLLIEFTVSFIACIGMMWLENGSMATTVTIPFFKNILIDVGLFYIPFALIVIVGTANAVNLTDGLDGLVSVPVIMATLVFMIIAYVAGRSDYASYLQIYHVKQAAELTVFGGAIIGGTLGFLWYNAHPAKVFMGDTGSLALGGALGTLAVATKHELVLAIAGGIFVAEALSDIIQVGSFKLRGKRVFLMAPLHHHFEKKGWSETTVVVRFWIVSILLALAALATLKLR